MEQQRGVPKGNSNLKKGAGSGKAHHYGLIKQQVRTFEVLGERQPNIKILEPREKSPSFKCPRVQMDAKGKGRGKKSFLEDGRIEVTIVRDIS